MPYERLPRSGCDGRLIKTGVHCAYFLCEYLAGEATNSDAVENGM